MVRKGEVSLPRASVHVGLLVRYRRVGAAAAATTAGGYRSFVRTAEGGSKDTYTKVYAGVCRSAAEVSYVCRSEAFRGLMGAVGDCVSGGVEDSRLSIDLPAYNSLPFR